MDYAGVIIEYVDKKMLFQLRDNKKSIPNPNRWGIFGGGIEENELPVDAAVRELDEELGLKIKPADLKLIIKIPLIKNKNYIYRLKINKNISTLKLMEGQKMKYMERKELLKKKNLVPGLRIFLRAYPLISLFR